MMTENSAVNELQHAASEAMSLLVAARNGEIYHIKAEDAELVVKLLSGALEKSKGESNEKFKESGGDRHHQAQNIRV